VDAVTRRCFMRVSAAGALAASGCLHAQTQPGEEVAMAQSDPNSAQAPKLKYVTYCGLYCGLCANLARIPKQARTLQDTMQKEGYEFFGKYAVEGFDSFWKALDHLSQLDRRHPGCRSGACGDPECKIRACAKAKGIDVCSACRDFPCKLIEPLAQRYPTLMADARRQQKVGVDQWIREQDARAATGFCYADIRCSD